MLEVRFDPDRLDLASREEIRREYLLLDNEFGRVDGVLRSPARGRSDVVVIQTHPRRASAMSLTAYPCGRLPDHGVDTFAFNNRATNSSAGTEVVTIWEDLALDVAAAVREMRARGYRYVVLYGHSAGGPLMSYYQNVAENGSAPDGDRTTLSGFGGFVRDGRELRLPPADGIILQNSTAGTGLSFLLRLDGSIVDESGPRRDPELDLFEPANGFDPSTGAGTYSRAFLRRYYRAQAERMNRLIATAQSRLEACRHGAGYFGDEELIVISGLRGEPSLVDLGLASRTTEPRPTYPSGSTEIVTSVRRVVPNVATRNRRFPDGGTVHTLRSFLSYRAIRVDPAAFDPEAVTPASTGVDLTSSNTITAANLAGVTVPLLVTVSTADTQVHFPAAELASNAAIRTRDRAIAFIEGAEHDMSAVHQDYGDTRAAHTRVVVSWLRERFPA